MIIVWKVLESLEGSFRWIGKDYEKGPDDEL